LQQFGIISKMGGLLYFLAKIWKNADFLPKSGRDSLMELTFRNFGLNKQSELSITMLDISFKNIDFP